jgi:uncharacterized protein DUF4349
MRRLDDTPLDPEIEASLDAIDATLAGEPVDPRFAELAELALMLADERPAPSERFARDLDARVNWRFATQPAARGLAPPPGSRRRRWNWAMVGGGALATGIAGVLAALVVVLGGSGGGSLNSASSAASTSAPAFTSTSSSSASGSAGTLHAASGATKALAPPNSQLQSPRAPGAIYGPSEALSPAPTPNGRVAIQSAQLDLGAPANRVDAVAQEVYNVVGQAGGIVDKSSITQTGGTDGYAEFRLRIPSAALAQTLSRLSELPGSTVLSRTDNTQDVNDQWISAHRKLSDDKALRAALLKQLAAATTTGEIDSLQSRIHDVEGAIASDEGAINSLSAQINYSKVVVTIAPHSLPPTPVKHHHSAGFLGHSAHIAGRVLVVAAGVALIALAGLVPVGLLAALVAWIAYTLRRRRREQALDLA